MSRGDVTGIQHWLEQAGLAKYANVFAEHEITLEGRLISRSRTSTGLRFQPGRRAGR